MGPHLRRDRHGAPDELSTPCSHSPAFDPWSATSSGGRAPTRPGAELESFLAMRADEKIAAGIAPPEARRLALLEMGGVEQVKEEVRDSRTGAWLDTFARDARSGLRLLARNPGFTAAAVRSSRRLRPDCHHGLLAVHGVSYDRPTERLHRRRRAASGALADGHVRGGAGAPCLCSTHS